MASESVDASEALDARARSVLKIVFVTLFLNLIGFSIIFRLFPSLLTHYMEVEGGEGIIGAIVDVLQRITKSAGGPTSIGIVVLFGGVLSSVYSLLQFFSRPSSDICRIDSDVPLSCWCQLPASWSRMSSGFSRAASTC